MVKADPPRRRKAISEAPKKPGNNTLEHKVKARTFLGKKNLSTVDNMPALFGPGTHQRRQEAAAATGISAAALASAALARRIAIAPPPPADALSEFRSSGLWRTPQIISALLETVAATEQTRGAKARATGFSHLARTLLALAVYGEVAGVKALVAALAKGRVLGPDQRRQIDGIQRLVGARQISVEQLGKLFDMISLAASPNAAEDQKKAVQLLACFDGVRNLGHQGSGRVSARQLLDLHAGEACLILTTGAEAKSKTSNLEEIVALLRNRANELVLVDAAGLYDVQRGFHDVNARISVMHKAQEIALADFLAATRPAPPSVPAARVICGEYLGTAREVELARLGVHILGGCAFRFC
jgi:hypothetical protein